MDVEYERSVVDIGTEILVWQGRPAPRCFTFRHWKRSLFWLFVFFAAAMWQWIGWQIGVEHSRSIWQFMPVPLLLLSFCLSVGRCIRARLEWEHVYYVLSDKKLRIQCGLPPRILCFDLGEMVYARIEEYAQDAPSGLGRIYIEFSNSELEPRSVILNCVEQAQAVFAILQETLKHKQA